MAQGVVIRFKADSTEYDAKLKRSIEQMKSMEDQAKKLQGSIDRTDGGYVKFVQSLGQMDTMAKSSKTALREYSEAILYLQQQYKELSDTEKSGDVGKAMAASIDQLKLRAAEAQDTIGDLNIELKNLASDTSTFDQLAGGANLIVSSFQLAQGAMQMLGVESDDAVQAIAKLQGAMALTSSLTKIQTALQKQSAVMIGIATIQKKAQAAAEALDTAAKGKNIVVTKSATVAQAALNAVAKANPYILLASAVAAVGVALYALSKSSRKAEEAEEKRLKTEEEAQRQADATRESFVNASAEAMNSASKISSLQTAYMNANSEMEKTGVLRQAQEEFKKLGIECNSLADAQNILINKGSQIVEMIRMQGTVAALSAIRMETYKKSFMNLLANGYDVAGAAALAGANSDVRQLDDQILKLQGKIQNSKSALGIGGGSKGGSGSRSTSKQANKPIEGSIAAQEEKVEALKIAWKNAADDKSRQTIKIELDEANRVLDEMMGRTRDTGNDLEEAFTPGSLNDLRDQLRKAQDKLANMSPEAEGWADALEQVLEKMAAVAALQEQINGSGSTVEVTNDMKSLADNVDKAIGAFGQLGGAIQQIEDPSAKVAGIIMGAIAEVAGSFAASLKGNFSTWDWIAAAIAGTATMISTIAAIKSATSGSYANGGIIPGNSFSGDNQIASVNAGELILSRSQQSNIAGQLQGNPMGGMYLTSRVSGKDILIAIDNTNRSEGGSRGYYTRVH